LVNFAEVDHVLGKAGRADTPTDPAPLSMLETVIVLKPQSEWRNAHPWRSSWAPRWLLPVLWHINARSQDALLTAVGGENGSTGKKARERCPVNVRYLRDFRSDLESLGRVLVPVTSDKQIPLSELSTIRTLTGPSMIRNEDGLLTEYVFVDVTDVPVGDAARSIAIGTWR